MEKRVRKFLRGLVNDAKNAEHAELGDLLEWSSANGRQPQNFSERCRYYKRR